MVKGWKALTFLAKSSIFDVWLGPEYALGKLCTFLKLFAFVQMILPVLKLGKFADKSWELGCQL